MDTQTDFQKHLNSCGRCRRNPNNMCPTGERLFLHQVVQDLIKEKNEVDYSYCDDCDFVNNPKCNKCLGV
jgi:hypothetical protein